jgi:hypothetical protein
MPGVSISVDEEIAGFLEIGESTLGNRARKSWALRCALEPNGCGVKSRCVNSRTHCEQQSKKGAIPASFGGMFRPLMLV